MESFGKFMSNAVGALVCWVLVSGTAFPQAIDNSLTYGTAYPIQDEFGNLLPGTASNPGALVHLLRYPGDLLTIQPNPDGTPNINTPILHTTFIGENVVDESSGQFFGIIAPMNRATQQVLFARVYNRPTVEDSSFYGNSRVFTALPNASGESDIFWIEIPQTNIEIDPNDDDGDGLSNSWEKSLGTNPLEPDTDGDGVSDYHEFLAGTDPLNDEDFLRMVELTYAGAADLIVEWSAVSGRTYQLEFTTNSLNDALIEYISVYDPVSATGDTISITFTNGALLENPHFRVHLAPE